MSDERAARPAEPTMLGPFLGEVTPTSIRIWLHREREEGAIHVTLHSGAIDAEPVANGTLVLNAGNLFTNCVTIDGLVPDKLYFYRLWINEAHSLPMPLEGLEPHELHFHTLSDDPDAQVDFVLMSCHNPMVATADGYQGHAIWADLPQIIHRDSNRKVRFAVLGGDQVYADDWEKQLLAEPDPAKRLRLYLSCYRQYWSNIHYRRVMCALPAMMIWDDHDITDGWGSRLAQFDGDDPAIKPEWLRLFGSAHQAFRLMQGSRNPATFSADPIEGLDFGFRAGRSGFLFLDLRTNRNLKANQLLTQAQFRRIQAWIAANQPHLDTLFVVSPVVFSHGSPVVEDLTLKAWPLVMRLVAWLASWGKWGQGLSTRFDKSLGDISDDIKDSWGSKENGLQTDQMLDLLFGLQNHPDHPVGVIVLSGDIHTSGYANLYSADPAHREHGTIPHITSSSVAYTPFNWLLEAIYRHASKSVALGRRGAYSSQISHHFCSRGVAVLSIRPGKAAGERHLKAKYYLEGYPEPQVLMFDLSRGSHRENMSWVAQDRLFTPDYAPSANLDIEALLVARARAQAEAPPADPVAAGAAAGAGGASDRKAVLPEDWRNSIVDLMKLLELDSSLGARKRLAQSWGYAGALNGSKDMNLWLHRQLIQRIRDAGGNVPADIEGAASRAAGAEGADDPASLAPQPPAPTS